MATLEMVSDSKTRDSMSADRPSLSWPFCFIIYQQKNFDLFPQMSGEKPSTMGLKQVISKLTALHCAQSVGSLRQVRSTELHIPTPLIEFRQRFAWSPDH
jgi:hypothetical protein